MTTTFFLGCALWGYKGWIGDFFPMGSRSRDFLRLYGERLTAVEGNTTFYSVPDAATIARWATETPATFQFCPKLPKSITHSGLLQPQSAAASQFLTVMQGLGNRLGPLFAQLPPSYGPDHLHDLAAFLTALPRHQSEFALEVRHLEWFRPPHAENLNVLLSELGVGRVLMDTRPIYQVSDDPQLRAERKKPRVPVDFSITAPFTVIRYISHPDWQANQPFVVDWLPRIADWLHQGNRVYCFMHCPVEARSPIHARSLQQLLQQQGAPIPALPWDTLETTPTQLSLL